MRADIHVCSDWRAAHDRPVYTLADACPECGADAVNSAPAPFNPEDPHGKYRRSLKRRRRD
ncbi:H/ACA ribonucleoprotein complex subunit 3 [Halomicrobium zhouii]|uniref:Ribosome biogenesis protein Nop10 n=1 Tax=Halomicrobium zhouii TaxID=767519 RepID=A0A1I6LHF3_9EURY|nr:RNA-protein complex protein Nop10 [Halomicrobium zhouii]SFS02889.1 H/ACA ribonucleoprotein complex subunit 3 [Halomicrobium zhouii]